MLDESGESAFYVQFQAPCGLVTLVANKAGDVVYIHLEGMVRKIDDLVLGLKENNAILKQPKLELEEYFQGTRRSFSFNVHLQGTAFQKKTLKKLKGIKYSQTATYSELAELTGNPKSARAVGGAIGRNVLPIYYPCHRIVGSNGKLTGFNAGLAWKRFLLDLEANSHRS